MKHTLYMLLRFIGMRDRLRCPDCGKVGTWKPHGGLLDLDMSSGIRGGKRRHVKRWLCKWCGYYRGPEGVDRCIIRDGTWQLPRWAVKQPKPSKETGFRPVDLVPRCDPWRG